MNSEELSLGFKHLLETVDRLEFTAERNRQEMTEMRQMLIELARSCHDPGAAPRKNGDRKQKISFRKKRGRELLSPRALTRMSIRSADSGKPPANNY